MKTAFVSGATGLLGNNLVRQLAGAGIHVRALARSRAKAVTQFGVDPRIDIIEGDMLDVPGFADAFKGCDALFHVAAHFRDSYKGGSHWRELERINVQGSAAIVQAACAAGVGAVVHTSSIAVLRAARGEVADETMDRAIDDADDYYRSKILAERAVREVMAAHADVHTTYILPGWMWGPGDIGPTSSGQFVLDMLAGRLPGIVPGSFSLVDARDVATAQIASVTKGRNGERYLAAGRHMTMRELVPLVGQIAEIKAPTRSIPMPLLYGIATVQEAYARLTGKPVLLPMAVAANLAREADRTRFDPSKSARELGLVFRPVEETVADTIAWYRSNGWTGSDQARAA